jgi:hypothetical protein
LAILDFEFNITTTASYTTSLPVDYPMISHSDEDLDIQEATLEKEEANSLYKQFEYDHALTRYKLALELYPIKCTNERAIVYTNMAACRFQQVL